VKDIVKVILKGIKHREEERGEREEMLRNKLKSNSASRAVRNGLMLEKLNIL
jgi:hypothetical protein